MMPFIECFKYAVPFGVAPGVEGGGGSRCTVIGLVGYKWLTCAGCFRLCCNCSPLDARCSGSVFNWQFDFSLGVRVVCVMCGLSGRRLGLGCGIAGMSEHAISRARGRGEGCMRCHLRLRHD